MTDELKHQQFNAYLVDDEYGPAVMIQQSDGCTHESVMLHKHQLRAICEHFGIVAPDAQAAQTVSTLQRRMLKLRVRIGDLEAYMAKHSDHKHADLSYEMTQIGALADLAIEWCADFEPTPGTTADPPKQSNEAPAPV